MNPALRQLAEHALIDAQGNWDEAKACLTRQLLTTPALYEQHVVGLVHEAVHAMITYLGRQARHAAYHGVERGKETGPSGRLLQGQRLFAIESLMDCPMLGGHKTIGDATKPELLRDAERYLVNARAHRVTGRFLSLIAEKLPDEQVPVRQTLTEAMLREMRGVAEREAVA